MSVAARGPCDEAILRATEPSPCSRATARWVLAATILGSSMAFIDATVVNVALPVLQESLEASVSNVQWVVETYDPGVRTPEARRGTGAAGFG
jgi:hypothetical protein